jgi:hypothetical protein
VQDFICLVCQPCILHSICMCSCDPHQMQQVALEQAGSQQLTLRESLKTLSARGTRRRPNNTRERLRRVLTLGVAHSGNKDSAKAASLSVKGRALGEAWSSAQSATWRILSEKQKKKSAKPPPAPRHAVAYHCRTRPSHATFRRRVPPLTAVGGRNRCTPLSDAPPRATVYQRDREGGRERGERWGRKREREQTHHHTHPGRRRPLLHHQHAVGRTHTTNFAIGCGYARTTLPPAATQILQPDRRISRS